MASINIDVSLDDARFLAFKKAFDAYQEGLDDSLAAWGYVADSSGKAAGNALVLANQTSAAASGMGQIAVYSEHLSHASQVAARAWDNIAKRTGTAAGQIKEATTALLKWSGIVSIVGGLAGAGGIVGMDALGGHVAGSRTGAMRAGTTVGGREAFNINFGRFGDTEGVLGRIANIQNSADHTALRNLGISDDQIRNMDPADLAALAFAKLREKTQGVNKNYLGDWLSSNRVGEVFDLGQALQARSTSAGEMQDVQSHYRKDRPRLEMTPQAQLGWTKFVLQLDVSGGILKRVFAENLSRLTGGLGKLSESFAKLLESLLKKGGPVEHWLTSLNDWLLKLANHIGSPAFERDLKNLWEGIKTLAKWTGALLRGLARIASWFGITPAAAATSGFGNGAGGRADGFGGRGGSDGGSDGGRVERHGRNRVLSRNETGGYRDTPNLPSNAPSGELKRTIDEAARKAGIDPRIMYGIHAGESAHGNRYDVKDDALESSWGPFQLNRRRGLGAEFERETGLDVRDPKTIKPQADWVAGYIAKHGMAGVRSNWMGYHGNREWDPYWGNAGYREAERPRHPAADVGNMPSNWKTKVLISKPPGGDLAAQANAAAHVSP